MRNYLIIKFIIINFILFIQTNLYSYERVYEYEVPDEINIIFKNYKKHLVQIDKAFKHPNPKGKKYIRDKFKRPMQITGVTLIITIMKK